MDEVRDFSLLREVHEEPAKVMRLTVSNGRPVQGVVLDASLRPIRDVTDLQWLRLAMEGQRDPLIVVKNVNGTSSAILATRIRSSGWIVGPIETHPATTTVVEPWLGADESGSALAVWISNDPSGHRVNASVLE